MDEEKPGFSLYPKKHNKIGTDRNNLANISNNMNDISQLPLRDSQYPQSIIHSKNIIRDPLNRISPIGHLDVPALGLSDPMGDTTRDLRFAEGSQLVPSKPSRNLAFEVDDLDIPWSDLDLRERIGAGSFWSLSEEHLFLHYIGHIHCI